MTNSEIVILLKQIAAAYIVTNENRFHIIAYEKAADAVSAQSAQLYDLWKEEKLQEVDGIGKTIASHLGELFRTGKAAHWEHVLKGLPAGMFPLLLVPGFGPKRAFKLAVHFNLTNAKDAVSKLLTCAKEGKIALLDGFGEKSQADIIESIGRYKSGQIKENRIPLGQAMLIANEIIDYMKQVNEVGEVVPLGSLRRGVSTIGDIDLAVATKHPEVIIEWFLKYPKILKTIESGPTGASIIVTNGRQVDLRVCDPSIFGSMLQYFTGSKNHNIRLREFALRQGLSLNEYGIKLVGKQLKTPAFAKASKDKQIYNSKLKIYEYAKEEEFYNSLGISWIPPRLREDRGEIQAAALNKLPRLVTLQDIKGDLHIHTNYEIEPSHDMGISSIEELIGVAQTKKYEYIGLSDHNPSIGNHTTNEIVSIMKRRKENIEHIISSQKSTRVHLVIMTEIDILPNGSLALPEKAFEYIDASIVSIHSSFRMDKKTMTKRILTGLSHPKAKILAHPTGRLIGQREGYDLDWQELFNFCKKYDKALEINASPMRLDTPDSVVFDAIKQGVKFVINTDAHEKTHMNTMDYGISVAGRGWAQKSDILNTLPYNDIKGWLLG